MEPIKVIVFNVAEVVFVTDRTSVISSSSQIAGWIDKEEGINENFIDQNFSSVFPFLIT